MLDLAEMKRAQYAAYNPRFHRPAANARDLHRSFLASQLERENSTVLVDDEDGMVNGFIIATTGPRSARL